MSDKSDQVLKALAFCPELGEAKRGDKLAGWPCWIQYSENPNCPKCQQRMQFVFQVASDNNLPYHFGDMGNGYLTQCPEHKDALAFLWQSF